jgi:hypothetical protein
MVSFTNEIFDFNALRPTNKVSLISINALDKIYLKKKYGFSKKFIGKNNDVRND